MDALAPGRYLEEIRQEAATAAARRVNWSDAAVTAAGGVCVPDAAHTHELFRCKIPFNVTFGGGTRVFWLTDRGGIESLIILADLEPYQRSRVLQALRGLK